MADRLSPSAAYAIASMWGSYMNDADPGRVFYTFPAGDARPQDDAHRAWCLQYTAQCLAIARGYARQCGHGDDDADVCELLTLQRFFREAETVQPERIAA
jgi:hypothetical protein